MIRQILSSGRLIFEVLLLGALVVLVIWWNPLYIFGGKPELQPTANIVSNIREVGEMITAEYYGEVLASIDEAQINLLEEEEIITQGELIYQEILTALKNLKHFDSLSAETRISIADANNELKRRERKKLLIDPVSEKNILEKLYFLEEWATTSQMPLYNEVLLFLGTEAQRVSAGAGLTDKLTSRILFHWYTDTVEDWWQSEAFANSYFESRLSSLSRRESRKKLAMIGRGTVKAGFNFQDLDQSMFHFNEEVGELHFFGLAPEILNSDINPWFIPEKGIPGFDILTYNGKVDFKDSRRVKIYAVQKLKANARKAGIIDQAESNGAETLSRLFTMLTGKEVKKVIFHHDKIIQLTREIKADRFINYEEAAQFENAVSRELNTIDSLRSASQDRYNNRNLAQNKWNTLVQMIAELRQLEFETQDLPYHQFATFWYEIARDSLIDENEWREMKAYARIETSDSLTVSLWTKGDVLWSRALFSEGLHQLSKKNLPLGAFEVDSTSLEIWKTMEKTSKKIRNVVFKQDSVVFEYFKPRPAVRDSLLHLIQPLRYDPELFAQWRSQKNSIETISKTDTITELSADPESFWLFKPGENNRLIKFNIPLDQVSRPDLLAADDSPDWQRISIDSLIIIRSAANFAAIQHGPHTESALDPDQQETLVHYLDSLYTSHSRFQNRDLITKTKAWFGERWESKSSISEVFQ
ncbi:Protein of unknown function [Cyclobacterium lianum]|uniref:Uncharacterized protein n=1 Tax=Cyclobacterium lianum TaxID=388280 RepID=A0A1M7QH25_9BACT|nr:DUF4230 domain-containing protein [Cyclobacterium lianum]SHN30302.1 Protein of unknown function [Cyclobacterium lianum]